jgi:hypothetical protein
MKKRFVSKFFQLIALTIIMFVFSGCWDEQHPGTYYTFNGQTIASGLASNANYSEFVKVLQRAGILQELSTYGHYTCFAPDNESIGRFLKERETAARKKGLDVTYNTVDDLPIEDCDTLAWTHLLDVTCYIGDLYPGLLPKVNLNDRFLILTLDSTHVEQFGDSVVALERRLNNSVIIAKDDSCENGVIHYIRNCIDFGGDYVYDLVDNDPKTKLFSEALKLAGFHKILSEWYDYSYSMGYDSVKKGIPLNSAGNDYTVFYWDKKKTNFTLLVPTDSIFHINGIDNVIPDMFDLAKEIYPEYNDNAEVMADYANPLNPLHKFLSYHILPFLTDLSRINGRNDIIKIYNAKKSDPEDYFETLLPKSLMRISTQLKNNELDTRNIYINRRDKEGNGTVSFKGQKVRGIRILTSDEMGVSKYSALNGVYHYIDGILKYDTDVREDVLDRRIRIDCTTLSPDFLTSGARQFNAENTGVSRYGSGFKDPKNFYSYQTNYTLSVRAPANNSYAYQGDGIDIEGQFDIYVKLPPVPHNGTWQLRLSLRGNRRCGIVQYYLAGIPAGQEVMRTDWEPLGIPCDLRFDNLNDVPSIGWVIDEDLEDQAAIEALDKSMKNRGWMKGPDTQQNNQDPPVLHRNIQTMARQILATQYMTTNTDYYLRIKQILDNNKAQFLFDYMELVPKSVYDMDEDKH